MAFLSMGDKGPSDSFVWGLIILFIRFFLELDEMLLGDKESKLPFGDGLMTLEDEGFRLLLPMVILFSELFIISIEALEEAELVLSELGVDVLEGELGAIGAGSSASGDWSILFILGIRVRGYD